MASHNRFPTYPITFSLKRSSNDRSLSVKLVQLSINASSIESGNVYRLTSEAFAGLVGGSCETMRTVST
jgi:hypothetical protein